MNGNGSGSADSHASCTVDAAHVHASAMQDAHADFNATVKAAFTVRRSSYRNALKLTSLRARLDAMLEARKVYAKAVTDARAELKTDLSKADEDYRHAKAECAVDHDTSVNGNGNVNGHHDDDNDDDNDNDNDQSSSTSSTSSSTSSNNNGNNGNNGSVNGSANGSVHLNLNGHGASGGASGGIGLGL